MAHSSIQTTSNITQSTMGYATTIAPI